MSHEELLAGDPVGQRQAAEHDILAKRRHVMEHGTEKGFTPTFPCKGEMEWQDQSSAVWEAVCSVCGFELGVPARSINPAAEIERRTRIAGFPEMFGDKPFVPSDGTAQARAMLKKWLDLWEAAWRPPSPALVGPPGRGKTHLLVRVAASLIRHHMTDVMYAQAGELIESMRSQFGNGDVDVTSGIGRRASRCGLLVLDDLAKPPTDWCSERVYELIDARYRAGLPILMSTNVPVGEWREVFTARTASRLAEMTAPVLVEGPDWRQSPPAAAGSLPDTCERQSDIFQATAAR